MTGACPPPREPAGNGPASARRFNSPAASRAATLVVLAASVFGLLCLRIDLYDDCAMLLGARLVQAGRLPYRDFYTHYGPLIYDFLSLFQRLPANPGVILRLAQISALILSTCLFVRLARRATDSRSSSSRSFSLTAVPVAVMSLSAVFQLPAFLAFSFSLLALGFFADLPTTSEQQAMPLRLAGLRVAGALALALATLVRPAFAAYAAGSLVLLAVFGVLADGERSQRWRAALGLIAGTLAFLAGLWILLYGSIPPATLWKAAVIGPARLMGTGSRFLPPDFFHALSPAFGSMAVTAVAGAVIFASTLAWLLGSCSRRVVRAGLTASVLAGLASLPLLRANATGRAALAVAAIWFLLALTVTVLAREEIRSSPILPAAASFGLASAAFSHYFWARPDRPHLVPLLGLAAAAAALAADAVLPRRRAAVGALFILAYLSLWRLPWAPFPAIQLFNGGVTRILRHARSSLADWQSIWPAGELPSDAARIVALADRNASPSSRFVAVSSSQAETSGDPILLFLLSARLPYTKWWAYDPGVQGSPVVQGEMEAELRASGSQTAVVWPAEEFFYEPPQEDALRPTEFDELFRRLYPRRVGRLGRFELRLRADGAPEK
jgi:hypothetical protein